MTTQKEVFGGFIPVRQVHIGILGSINSCLNLCQFRHARSFTPSAWYTGNKEFCFFSLIIIIFKKVLTVLVCLILAVRLFHSFIEKNGRILSLMKWVLYRRLLLPIEDSQLEKRNTNTNIDSLD